MTNTEIKEKLINNLRDEIQLRIDNGLNNCRDEIFIQSLDNKDVKKINKWYQKDHYVISSEKAKHIFDIIKSLGFEPRLNVVNGHNTYFHVMIDVFGDKS